MVKKRRRILMTVTVEPDVMERIDALAAATGSNRSKTTEKLILDSLDDHETTARALTDPVIVGAFAKAFGDRDVMRRMAAAVASESDPAQLELFAHAMTKLTGVLRKKGRRPGKKVNRK